MGSHTQRAGLIDLTVRVRVANVQNACEQHERDTGNSQDGYPGKPSSASCRHETHVIETIREIAAFAKPSMCAGCIARHDRHDPVRGFPICKGGSSVCPFDHWLHSGNNLIKPLAIRPVEIILTGIMRIAALVESCLFLGLSLAALGQGSAKKQSANQPQAAEDKEPIAILEIGAATNWDIKGGAAAFAPNIAAETTPIPNWLELEAGVSPFYTRKSTEWDTDLLFKKPWDLSRKSEFMLGVGPEWVHLSVNGKTSNSIAGELAGDFMFWPSGRHKFGWFLEPAYDYSFSGGHQESIGVSAGLLIGIR